MPIAIAINGSPTRLCQTDMPIAVGIVYTAPNAARIAILDILIANTTTSTATISLYMNGSVAANAIMSSVSLGANTTTQLTCFQVLNAGESLYALSSIAGVTLTASGMQGL